MKPERTRKRVQINDHCIFDLLILAAFVLFTIQSFEYNPRARVIPMGLGVIGGIMMLLQFLVDAFPELRLKLRFLSQRGLLGGPDPFKGRDVQHADWSRRIAFESHQTEKKVASWARVFRIILWLAGFVALLKAVYYLVAVGLFILFLTKMEARESWGRSLSVAVGTCVAFYLLFDVILNANL